MRSPLLFALGAVVSVLASAPACSSEEDGTSGSGAAGASGQGGDGAQAGAGNGGENVGAGGDGAGASGGAGGAGASGGAGGAGTAGAGGATGCASHEDCDADDELCVFSSGTCAKACNNGLKCPAPLMCDDCATSSCPACDDCLAACVP